MTIRLKDYGEFGIPPSHRDYLEPAPTGTLTCETDRPHVLGFFWCCTRRVDHTGKHAAHLGNKHMVATWEDESCHADGVTGRNR